MHIHQNLCLYSIITHVCWPTLAPSILCLVARENQINENLIWRDFLRIPTTYLCTNQIHVCTHNVFTYMQKMW